MIIYESRSTSPSWESVSPHLHFVSNQVEIKFRLLRNIMNIRINGVGKQLIKQPRPKKHQNKRQDETKKCYGMPSGHAQSAAANFVFIALLFATNSSPRSPASARSSPSTNATPFLHTAPQLLVGSILGGASGYALYQCYRLLFLTPPKSKATATATAMATKGRPPSTATRRHHGSLTKTWSSPSHTEHTETAHCAPPAT